MNISEKIKLFMQEKNISDLKSFSKKANIPYTTLVDICKKNTAENSRFSTVKKLSDYMKCSLDYIAYDEVSDKKQSKKGTINK